MDNTGEGLMKNICEGEVAGNMQMWIYRKDMEGEREDMKRGEWGHTRRLDRWEILYVVYKH